MKCAKKKTIVCLLALCLAISSMLAFPLECGIVEANEGEGSSLKEITIPKGVTDIAPRALACDGLAAIYAAEENPSYCGTDWKLGIQQEAMHLR